MRLTRIYQAENLIMGACFSFSKETSHRLVKVLRAKLGDQCLVFDGRGNEALCEITGLTKSQVSVEVIQILDNSTESPIHMHLFQALCKNDKMDWLIQKSVELGVTQITPVITKHCDIRISKEKFLRNHERWQNIIVSACEQSGRNVIPKLHFVRELSDCLNNEDENKFILSPSQDGDVGLFGNDGSRRNDGSQFSIMIGPEGGFNQSEIAVAKESGWQATQLGPRILRTETAAIVMLSILQNQFGDFK